MSAKPETSLRYLKRIDSKMNKLLALATRYVEGAPPAASVVATEPEELPFYFQSNAAAAAAANAAAPAAAAANANAVNAAANAPAAKLNNWNRHVTEVLQQMREAKWKNPNTGKNATRRNAMKEASRRKAETNSNYAAKAASRREKRNKQLAKKGLSAVAEVPAAAVVASNLPAATSGNLVAAAPASAALAAEAPAAPASALAASAEAAAGANVAPPLGPPRKGNGRPPPSFYQKFKAPSVPIIQAPPPGQQESRLYHNWNPPTITNVYSTQAPAQRQARSLQRSIDGAYAHPSWQAQWKKKINNLKPAINAEVAAGIKLEND